MSRFFLGLLTVILISIASPVAYACSIATCPPTILDSTPLFNVVIYTLLSVSLAVFFLMLVITGYRYMVSLGNPEKVSHALRSLVYVIVGFGSIFLAFVIIEVIYIVTQPRTGTNVDTTTGKINVNVQSTFIATPLPGSKLDTTSDTPISTGNLPPAGCGDSPATSPGCFTKVSSWYSPPNSPDGDGEFGSFDTSGYEQTSAIPTAITMVMDAYFNYMQGNSSAVHVSDVLTEMIKDSLYTEASGVNPDNFNSSAWTTALNNISTNLGYNSMDWQVTKYPPTSSTDLTDMENILNHGYPVIAFLNIYNSASIVQTDVVTGYSTSQNLIYVTNPLDTSITAYSISDWESFQPAMYILLLPGALTPV